MFDAVCRIAVEVGRFSMAGVVLLDAKTRLVRPVKAAGNTELFERLGAAPDAGGPEPEGPTATALRTGTPVICQDIAIEACALPWREAMLQAGFRSSGNFPIARGDQIIGALVLYAAEAGYFDEQLQELLARLAANVSFALDAMEKEREKRAAQQALEDRQNALSTLLAHLPGMAYRCRADEARTTEFVSEGCFDLTGFHAEDLIGNRRISYGQIIHPEDRTRVREELRRAGHDRFVLRYRIVTATGEIRWVWEQGQVVGGSAAGLPLVEGIVQDVTGQATAERLLDERRQQLLLALDATDQGLWDWNLTTGRIFLDRATTRILGLGEGELEAPGEAWFDRIHATDAAAVTDAIRNHLAGRTDHCHGEYRMCLDHGEFGWVGTSGRVIERSPEGRALRMVGTVVDISERKRSEERLAFLAHFDELTGLPNRALFRDRLHTAIARARRTRKQLAVLALDLHRFNQINDTLGHAVGDQILRDVALRLRSCLRDVDTIARLGGDDFTLLIEDIDHPGDLTRIAECIRHSFSLPLDVDGREVFVSASIGIALYPRDTEDADELIRNADAALYRAKGLGGNAHIFYDAEMGSRTVARLNLESELHRALERDEFVVHYQPKVCVDTLRIVGAEALVRWNSRNGVIPPAEFIPIAEETGLILDIGRWVMQAACNQAVQWQRAGLPPIGMAVNLSPRQFMQRDLFETIDNVLSRSGLDPKFLEFEITESMLMHQGESVIDTLERLSAMGVRLAIDDFGTGYSSLAYLKRFPVQDIKIDRSFIRNLTDDPDDTAIVTAVAHMTRSLGLNLIAEGVETEDQLATLRRLRCGTFQGYLFSKPLPPREFAALLALDAKSAGP
jgi:diguanylate cyclase (GGDEF)-like protein/PAS domain S-box-containing protein